MLLTVAGMNQATEPNRFKNLFGRYIQGFNPWTHCDGCFKAKRPMEINPAMLDGEYELRDELFYLCGVGHGNPQVYDPSNALRQTNVHLGVRPRKGSYAAVGSVYGVTFVIKDAQAIPIAVPEELLLDRSEDGMASRLATLDRCHRNCKMFLFGMQVFEVDPKQLTTPGETVTERRDLWKPLA